MGQYSIRELEQLTGIKAHTIRMWEQRYNILQPKRSGTNIRTYDDADLKHILNVSLLNQHGYKISKIASLTEAAMMAAVLALSDQSNDCPYQIGALVAAMIDLNEERFDKVLTTVILQKGFEGTVEALVLPFLHKIGILWQTGNINPAHEHFVSNIIRQKFIVAIDGQITPVGTKATHFILFLPEGELHELGLLFMQYILRARQFKVLYLGQNLPFADLIKAYESWRPAYLGTIITAAPAGEHVQPYLNLLAGHFAEATVFMSGYQVQNADLTLPANCVKLKDLQEFRQIVDQLPTGPATTPLASY